MQVKKLDCLKVNCILSVTHTESGYLRMDSDVSVYLQKTQKEVNYADYSSWYSDWGTVLRILYLFMAFDTIHHSIRLCWLRVLGMKGTAL